MRMAGDVDQRWEISIIRSELVASWHAQDGDRTIADRNLGRLIHHAHRIERQASMRKKKQPASHATGSSEVVRNFLLADRKNQNWLKEDRGNLASTMSQQVGQSPFWRLHQTVANPGTFVADTFASAAVFAASGFNAAVRFI